ncbi:MAG: diguanylate cyclase [Dehalococcoidia bacterium]|nr:diguanylate cyclase [Dehalococcoidia bacterium]
MRKPDSGAPKPTDGLVESEWGRAMSIAYVTRYGIIVRASLITITTVIVFFGAPFFPGFDPVPVYVLYALALAVHGLAWFWARRTPLSVVRSWVVVAVDVLVVTTFIYLTGGLVSLFPWLYLIVVMRPDVVLRGRGTQVAFAATLVLLWGHAWLSYTGVIPRPYVLAGAPNPYNNPSFLLMALLFHTFALSILMFLTTYLISTRQRDALRSSHMAVVRTLTTTVGAHAPQAVGEGERIARHATAIAREMRVGPMETETIRDAALVCDVGMALLPQDTISQTVPLDPVRQAQIMRHPLVGVEILAATGVMQHVLPLVRHHHEFVDGTGYPDGLSGEAIPLGARILAVADAFEAMTMNGRLSPEQALAELRRMAGSQFDPRVVQSLAETWRKGLVTLPPPTSAGRTRVDAGRPLAAIPLPWALDMRPSTQQKVATALLRLGGDVSAVLNMETLSKRVCEILQEAIPCSSEAFLFRATKETFVVACGMGRWSDHGGKRVTPLAGPVTEALGTGDPALLTGTGDIPAFAELLFAGGAAILLPLRHESEVNGLVVMETAEPNGFTEEDLRLTRALVPSIGLMLEVAVLHRQTAEAAVTDSLTGLHNHRYFKQRLEEEIARARRLKEPLTLAVLDIDRLKQINDNYGHLAGDTVLQRVGAVLRREMRGSDVTARYGGDEFVVIMPEATKEAAETVVQRAAQAFKCQEPRLETGGKEVPLPGISWGLATFPLDGQTSSALFSAADAALYQSRTSKGDATPRQPP